MTLMDTAQLLGNFGEFGGAIAVVATLVYLAYQIRQNTRSSYASRQHTVQAEFSRLHEQVVGNEALAELIARCRYPSLGDLSPADDERVQAFANHKANTYASIELAHQAGQFDEIQYEVYCYDFRRFLNMYPALVPRVRAILEQDHAEHWVMFKPLYE